MNIFTLKKLRIYSFLNSLVCCSGREAPQIESLARKQAKSKVLWLAGMASASKQESAVVGMIERNNMLDILNTS